MDLQAGYVSAKAIFDIAKGINSLNTEAERNLAVIDIQRQAIETQQGYAAVLKRIDELENQIVQFENWDREAERYQLTEFPTGAVAYVLKPTEANGEPSHRLCPNCYQDRKKAILQTTAKHSGGEMVDCLRCKSRLILSEFRPTPPPNDRGSGYY